MGQSMCAIRFMPFAAFAVDSSGLCEGRDVDLPELTFYYVCLKMIYNSIIIQCLCVMIYCKSGIFSL